MNQILRQQIEKIIKITDTEFAYVLSHFVAKKFKKHQFVIQEGQLVENDFFVLTGCLNPIVPMPMAKTTSYNLQCRTGGSRTIRPITTKPQQP